MREVRAATPPADGTRKSFLVEVIPIGKNHGTGTLSYFSSAKLAKGALVRVPVRNRLAIGVVLNCRDAREAKIEIRRAGFLLKKIRKTDILAAEIASEFLEAAEIAAEYYAARVGAVLAGVMPKIFLDEPETFLKPLPTKKRKVLRSSHKEVLLLQMETEERFGQYRALVRQNFAKGKSVMFVVPTHLDLRRAQNELSKGIVEFVHVFSPAGSSDNVKKTWVSALSEPHPILFITTPAGLILRRPDLETIIIERENSRAYRTLARPYLNFKNFIEYYSRSSGKELILGDSVFSLETLWREKEGLYGENSLIRWRLSRAPTRLVDARSSQNERGRFEIFSKELKELLEKAVAEKGKIFLFGARKGLAPTTVCGDCGTILECLNCKAPVVLHHRGDLRIYICHACGARRESETRCAYCKSWKLVPLGIGTEEIAHAAQELFPREHVHILDKDHAPTDRSAASIVKKFEEGGIMVGTELAFFHLESVPYSAVVSMDALFSIPDFGINERIFYIISRLREMTQKESVIQTRNIGREVLSWAAHGNIIDFYSAEIEERKALLYPPFSIFIKITVPQNSRFKIHDLRFKFEKWNPDILKDSIVMRIPRENWPDKELREMLALLPQEFSIKVDPESIL